MKKKNEYRLIKWGKKFWNYIASEYRFSRFFLIPVLIFLAWYVFIWLVGTPPIDTTPALIMVWTSILIGVLAIFPILLKRISRIKFKDFELELQKEVEGISKNILVTEMEIPDHYLIFEKSDFGRLIEVIQLAKLNPDKSILLTVDLNKRILIPFLYTYIILLNAIGSSVLIHFISRGEGFLSNLGVANDSIVVKALVLRFPQLLDIIRDLPFSEILERTDYQSNLEGNLRDLYETHRFNSPEYLLSENNVSRWLIGNLSNTTVNQEFIEKDIQKIKRAIMRNEKYIIVLQNDGQYSVISICDIGIIISRKALMEL
jgi:hypothetical protein